MKSLKFFIIGVIFILISSCPSKVVKNEPSEISEEFYLNFYNCIEILSLMHLGYIAETSVISNAYNCLEVLVGAESSVIRGSNDPFIFGDRRHFLQDVQTYNQWYNKNKSIMDMDVAESIFKKERKPFPDYSDSMIIKRAFLLYSNEENPISKDSIIFIKQQLNWPPLVSELSLSDYNDY